jgi:uncharacterized protein (DUF1015 family)
LAEIRPFAGIHYDKAKARDVSALIAPPYDVLDERQKAALVAKNPHNIVSVDLPHLPPKGVGPDHAYQDAARTLQDWLAQGVLVRDRRPAIYPYTQSYEHAGRTCHRRGFVALVKLSPFGQGEVVPHEQTYAGAIEDRLKLMTATSTQLSPVFGLFDDPRNEVTNLLHRGLGRPELTGTMEEVRNDLWTVTDADIENKVIDLMRRKAIYIADGHHRYTTALQYRDQVAAGLGGKLPPHHPAAYCMFVLVSMQDPGLMILPTHRLIGNLASFSIDELRHAVAEQFEVIDSSADAEQMGKFVADLQAKSPAHTLGLFEGRSRKLYELRPKGGDVLKSLEPARSDAWRKLDVAILQRHLLEEVIQPRFAPGAELLKGYTPDASAIAPQVDGRRYQIALLLRPTPLQALQELGAHNEVMPPKSTYFAPKLATGMLLYPLK